MRLLSRPHSEENTEERADAWGGPGPGSGQRLWDAGVREKWVQQHTEAPEIPCLLPVPPLHSLCPSQVFRPFPKATPPPQTAPPTHLYAIPSRFCVTVAEYGVVVIFFSILCGRNAQFVKKRRRIVDLTLDGGCGWSLWVIKCINGVTVCKKTFENFAMI